jgi:glycosyltransferase involved in cell wall biosynthesis
VASSVRKPRSAADLPDIVIFSLVPAVALRAVWLCILRWNRILPLTVRVVFCGNENPQRRLKALIHTFLGACYAVMLQGREVDHIHIHHGYFGSWIAMTAARLMNVGFSLTLHGSDLLVNAAYLDVKLKNCDFCLTVSEYNKRYILERHPEIDAARIVVAHLGVALPDGRCEQAPDPRHNAPLSLLAVGRLHAVKDHGFLVEACSRLRILGVDFECFIAGEGSQRRHLQWLIQKLDLEDRVTLLGHIPREQMDSLYARADAVLLTSRSEGIPLVLMEAMARGKIVVAPAITGIPELVISGKTGFLYEPRSLESLVDRLLFVQSLVRAKRCLDQRDLYPHVRSAASLLHWIQYGAQVQVQHNFDRRKNLQSFGDQFVRRIAKKPETIPDENLVLQQI